MARPPDVEVGGDVRIVESSARRVSALLAVGAAVGAVLATGGDPRDGRPGTNVREAWAVTASAVVLPVARPAAAAARASTNRNLARPGQAAPVQDDRDLQRAQAALRSLRFPWQRLGYRVVFTGPRSDRLATIHRSSRTITLHVRPGQSLLTMRASLAHEIGHALDFTYGSADRHRRYLAARGLPTGTPWYPCGGCDDLGSPAGDYAEVFAYAVAGPGDFRSRLAGPPDRRQLAEVADLLSIPVASAPSPRTSAAPAAPAASPAPRSLLGGLPPPPAP